MASIKVKFRPSTASGREGSIYYQVIHGRIVRQVKTDYRIFDTEWDKRTSSVKILSEIGENRKRYLREVAEHIDWDTRRLKAIVAQCDRQGGIDSADSIVEKFDPNKIWTAALYDADQQNYPYLKRFCFEGSNRKQNYLGDNKNTRLILLTDEYYPRLEVIFGGHDSFREAMVIDAEEFIAVKGFKAKGKRITTYTVDTINELEPTRFPEPTNEQPEQPEEEPENLDPDSDKSEGDIIDEITGQMKLF